MPIIKEDPLKPYNSSTFAFKSVKGEVDDAIHFDWKRDKVDDAKKRAIHQAPTYDDFKQRVAGCTLKPIHRDEFNKPPKHVYNRNSASGEGIAPPVTGIAVGAVGAGYAVAAAPSKTTPQLRSSQRAPKTGHEFERNFRRCVDSSEMVSLLRQLDSDAIARLFGSNIDAEFLRKVLVALDDAGEPGVAREFLTALAVRCPVSVASAVVFYGDEERRLVARLLAKDRVRDQTEDVLICATFSVPQILVAETAASIPVVEESATVANCETAPFPTCDPAPIATCEPAPTATCEPDASDATVPGVASGAQGEPGSNAAGNCDEMD